MLRGTRSLALVAGLVLAGAAACGGSSEQVTRPPESPLPTATASASASAAATPTSSVTRHPTAAVRPSTGLVNGQTVTVTGQGFSPGEQLVVVQCLDRGTRTGSGDCNLSGLQSVQTDAAGKVTTRLTVSKGPFGTPPVLCSSTQKCLVSVTQATPTPTEEADVPISFR